MLGLHFTNIDGAVDWPRLAASGMSFAYVRATFGTNASPELPAAWDSMRAAGIRRGAYHILRHDQDAIEQAVQFLVAVQFERGDLPPALQVGAVEGRPTRAIINAMREWLAAVESELEARHGHPLRPLIQVSDRVWRALDNPPGFAAHPLWIVDWNQFDAPRTPASWGERQWTIHQYAGDTRGIPGTTRPADLDRFGLVKVGDRGPVVAHIKELLGRAGFPAGKGEGFDPVTRRAVLQFQAARRLIQDGIVGVSTFAELMWP
jgi:lysozyme